MTAVAPWETPPSGPAAVVAAGLAARIPALETERLRLRAPRIEAFDAYARIVAGPEGAHVGGPFDREEAWLDFAQMAAGWLLRGTGLWSVERRADGALIGFLPLNHEFGDPELEIGWFLVADARGQGYAAEAAEAARRFAFAELGASTLVSYIDRTNDRSLRLAERLGARAEPLPHPGDPEVLVLRHPAPEIRA